jgi:hypothetical protein
MACKLDPQTQLDSIQIASESSDTNCEESEHNGTLQSDGDILRVFFSHEYPQSQTDFT